MVFVYVNYFILEHLDVWGELASHKRLFNPPPQFSRLGILVSLRPIFLGNFHFLCVMYMYVCLCLSGLGSPLFHYTL